MYLLPGLVGLEFRLVEVGGLAIEKGRQQDDDQGDDSTQDEKLATALVEFGKYLLFRHADYDDQGVTLHDAVAVEAAHPVDGTRSAKARGGLSVNHGDEPGAGDFGAVAVAAPPVT